MSDKKIVFRTQLSFDTNKFVTESGSPTEPEYATKIDPKTGAVDYCPTGEVIDVQGMIDAAFESVDIHSLMKRFQLGDVDAFNRREGFYGDVREMPKNMAEMFARVQDCKTHFEQLPVEVKEEFNNSYTEYFSMMNDNPRAFTEKINTLDEKYFTPTLDVPDMPSVGDSATADITVKGDE